MEKAEDNRDDGCFSRDLLHKFVNGKRNYEFFNEDEDGIELSLGLSMNGKFGIDPKGDKKLKRSSSSITSSVLGENHNNNGSYSEFQFPVSATCQLVRTCSLPAETEEQWRKRKDLESLRRLEAKRKRLEKMKIKKENNEENGNSLGLLSQASGSSEISDLESQTIQSKVPSDTTEARPPSCSPSSEHGQKSVTLSPPSPPSPSPETTNGKPPAAPGTIGKEARQVLRNFMQNMPCVSTRGDGPNGKKIDGFLYYGYKKGEEVKIVCVCHGNFLSPAEFVKHAGGGDVDHPLRHIIINPSPLL